MDTRQERETIIMSTKDIEIRRITSANVGDVMASAIQRKAQAIQRRPEPRRVSGASIGRAKAEAEVLAELEKFGEVVTMQMRPSDWICQVIASKFDGAEYSADYRRDSPFRTKLAAMESCLGVILRHGGYAAGFHETAAPRKANPSPATQPFSGDPR